jgi:hypothetical protein
LMLRVRACESMLSTEVEVLLIFNSQFLFV